MISYKLVFPESFLISLPSVAMEIASKQLFFWWYDRFFHLYLEV